MKKFAIRLSATVLLFYLCAQTAFGAQLLVPGGQVIGLEIQDHTLTVAAFDENLGQAAREGGLKTGDRLVSVNGTAVHSVLQVQEALKKTDGAAELSVLREGQPVKLRVFPQITEAGPRLGVYLKQGVTGVGTVTWYDPESGSFGALGHGVNDPQGSLVKMVRGNVYDAAVITVRQGRSGQPGQLMSAVTGSGNVGAVEKNTPQGVFGKARLAANSEPLPVGSAAQVQPGQATIRSTVCGNAVQEYSVEILKVYPNSGATGRNMLLKVTDPALIAATGGIVQGMSGSPIIQDGKLVGAVTHVLVNDPTTGYGIFIENMLDAAA